MIYDDKIIFLAFIDSDHGKKIGYAGIVVRSYVEAFCRFSVAMVIIQAHNNNLKINEHTYFPSRYNGQWPML